MTTPSTASITPHFLEDLAALKQELAREGEVVAARLSSAIKGLVDHDLDMGSSGTGAPIDGRDSSER